MTAPVLRRPSSWSPRVVASVATALTLPLIVWLCTVGTWDLDVRFALGGDRFFQAQADAIVDGRLWVDAGDLLGECYTHEGRCYGYYGVTPSALRILVRPLGTIPSPVWAASATAAAMWVAIELVASFVARSGRPSPRYVWAAAIGLGAGSVLMTAAHPFVYNEAVLWSAAFAVASMSLVARWTWSRHDGYLVAAAVTATAAANARPTFVVPALVLGVGAGWWSWRRSARRWPALAAAAALALLPLLTCVGVYAAKFGSVAPDLTDNELVPETPTWAAILERNGGETVGAVFVPTTALAYLRPDALRPTSTWPFVDFVRRSPTWVPPLPAGGAYAEPTSSLTSAMPVPSALVVLAFVGGVLHRRRGRGHGAADDDGDLCLLLLLAAAAAPLVTLGNVAITQRYLTDFYPLLAVGVATFPAVRTRPTPRWLVVLAVPALAWSVVANVGVADLIH